MLLLSVLVLSFVLALKRVFNKRSSLDADSNEIDEVKESALDDVSSMNYNNSMRHLRNSHSRVASTCEQISKEEYEYQSNVVTKQEIHKLVQS